MRSPVDSASGLRTAVVFLAKPRADFLAARDWRCVLLHDTAQGLHLQRGIREFGGLFHRRNLHGLDGRATRAPPRCRVHGRGRDLSRGRAPRMQTPAGHPGPVPTPRDLERHAVRGRLASVSSIRPRPAAAASPSGVRGPATRAPAPSGDAPERPPGALRVSDVRQCGREISRNAGKRIGAEGLAAHVLDRIVDLPGPAAGRAKTLVSRGIVVRAPQRHVIGVAADRAPRLQGSMAAPRPAVEWPCRHSPAPARRTSPRDP